MAKKRMSTTQVTDSDEFIDMASSTQALWWHLNGSSDDDGFNNQIQMAMYKAHASIDDLKVLLAKRFILQFESGVIVIKHWRMANAIRKDRYIPTVFQDELSQLDIKENGSYTFGNQMATKWQPNDNLDKISIDKVSIDKNNRPTQQEVVDYCIERDNYVDPYKWYDCYSSNGWKVGKNTMKDWKACVRTWERNTTKILPKNEPKKVSVPTYDTSKNNNMSEEELNELLALRGKK